MSVLFALAALLQVAAPPSLDQRLERAAICFRVGNLACAESELEVIRTQLPRLVAPLRQQALRLSAELALTQGRDADLHLDRLLAFNSDWRPPDGVWSADWSARLETVRAQRAVRQDHTGPRLQVQLLDRTPAERAVLVTVRTVDPTGVTEVRIRWGAALEVTKLMRPLDKARAQWSATLDAPTIQPPRQLVAIEAIDGAGNASIWGPQAFDVDPLEPPEAFYEQWWFWTAAGVVVAGATAAVLLSRARDPVVTRVDVGANP